METIYILNMRMNVQIDDWLGYKIDKIWDYNAKDEKK